MLVMSGTRIDGIVSRVATDVSSCLEGLRSVRSPRSRLIAATRVLELLRGAQQSVVKVRDRAIGDLVASGSTYAQLGEIAGLTRGRVAQIVQGGNAQSAPDGTAPV